MLSLSHHTSDSQFEITTIVTSYPAVTSETGTRRGRNEWWLHPLQQVALALTTAKEPYCVPYGDCVVTRLLQGRENNPPRGCLPSNLILYIRLLLSPT